MLNLLGLIDKFQRELVVEGTLDGLALVIGFARNIQRSVNDLVVVPLCGELCFPLAARAWRWPPPVLSPSRMCARRSQVNWMSATERPSDAWPRWGTPSVAGHGPPLARRMSDLMAPVKRGTAEGIAE